MTYGFLFLTPWLFSGLSHESWICFILKPFCALETSKPPLFSWTKWNNPITPETRVLRQEIWWNAKCWSFCVASHPSSNSSVSLIPFLADFHSPVLESYQSQEEPWNQVIQNLHKVLPAQLRRCSWQFIAQKLSYSCWHNAKETATTYYIWKITLTTQLMFYSED